MHCGKFRNHLSRPNFELKKNWTNNCSLFSSTFHIERPVPIFGRLKLKFLCERFSHCIYSFCSTELNKFWNTWSLTEVSWTSAMQGISWSGTLTQGPQLPEASGLGNLTTGSPTQPDQALTRLRKTSCQTPYPTTTVSKCFKIKGWSKDLIYLDLPTCNCLVWNHAVVNREKMISHFCIFSGSQSETSNLTHLLFYKWPLKSQRLLFVFVIVIVFVIVFCWSGRLFSWLWSNVS